MEIRLQLDPMRNFVAKNWFKLSILAILVVFAIWGKPIRIGFGGDDPTTTSPQARETITQSVAQQTTEAGILSGWGIESDGRFETLSGIDEAIKKAYLKRFAKVAVQEQQKFGIPASVILSTALLQSESGTRNLSVAGFNHFGLPCGESWVGKRAEADSKFRAYDSAWGSFRDFSKYIVQAVGTQKPSDVEVAVWLDVMQKSGVLSNKSDVENLQSIVEKYNLSELDVLAKK